MPTFTVLLLVFVGGAIAVAFWLGRMTAPVTADPRSAAEIAERDAFIEQLRELAWQHRDVSPELSTIVIDEITQRHRRGLPGS
ncbi:hypothetical protein EXE58_03250 [Nocardioides seonyuensis]|uniref:Uncharacterized protein n=1 Tax=Nocardioides seonyuensis TaxID=2518371 RepID=A0A4P7IDB8_9ACTN|nr:hypothetical protein [Nocardioides seonyuensis]QBX54583.1 hypothetical protein EXE58_03250 [Nocardioides seonyuensis]